jgi:hypothetical protein
MSPRLLLLLFICGAGMERSPILLRSFIGLLYQLLMIDGDDCGAGCGMNVAGETELLGGTLPHCRPLHHTSHMTTRAANRATAVGNRRQTTWAPARPLCPRSVISVSPYCLSQLISHCYNIRRHVDIVWLLVMYSVYASTISSSLGQKFLFRTPFLCTLIVCSAWASLAQKFPFVRASVQPHSEYKRMLLR